MLGMSLEAFEEGRVGRRLVGWDALRKDQSGAVEEGPPRRDEVAVEVGKESAGFPPGEDLEDGALVGTEPRFWGTCGQDHFGGRIRRDELFDKVAARFVGD